MKNLAAIIVSFSFLFSNVNAFSVEGCNVDYSLMYTLAKVERHSKKEVGYPFLISLNNKADQVKARNIIEEGWLDNRSIDCGDVETCTKNLKLLIDSNIENVDLGAFQANFIWFKYPYNEYFNLRDSYKNACERIEEIAKNEDSWTWETVAIYHSRTKKINKKYSNILKNVYARLYK